MELVEFLIEQARARASSPAVICRGVMLTHSGLAAAVARHAHRLMSAGVSPGERVGICLGNGLEFVVAYYGAMAAGAVAVPLNPSMKPDERRALVEMLSPALIVDGLDVADGGPGNGASGHGGLNGAHLLEHALVRSGARRGAIAAIVVTSGSTGEPKGVMLTGRALLSNALGMGDAAGAEPGQTHLVTLPLFHSFGATVSMNMPLATGGCCSIVPTFMPEAVAAVVESTRPCTWAAVPAMFAAMAASRCDSSALATIRTCISGGAPLARGVRDAFEAKFGVAIREGYGLTEAGPVVSATRHDDVPEHGCVGRPIAGVRVATEPAHEADGYARAELMVGSDGLMEGYFGRPDLTAAVLCDGWLRTGDIASVDGEGRLRILDRASYVINVGGFKVYPGEVEAVLTEHHLVAEAMAIGMPDAVRGQVVAGLVTLKPGCSGAGGATGAAAEIARYARERMAAHKAPRRVSVVDELPRNDMGKLDRAKAIEIVREATQGDQGRGHRGG